MMHFANNTATNFSCAAAEPASPQQHGEKRFVTLIDPAFKAGLLQVPLDKTFETKGRNEWLRGLLRKDLSLCCLFQKGRCHAEDRCHQVHVDRVFMESLRAQQARIVSCCAHCHDTASLAPAALSFFATHFGGGVKVFVSTTDGSGIFNEIPADRVAYTTGLVQHFDALPLSEQGAVAVILPGKKVCRLHLRAACKYGKDCKSLHICSSLTEEILRAPFCPAPRPAPRPAQPMHFAPQVQPLRAPLAIGTGFAERAVIMQQQPTAPAQQQQQVATPVPAPAPTPAAPAARPMPTFTFVTRAVDLGAGRGTVERDPLHLSCSDSQLDAVDVNEASGRLSGIVFDPKRALEDSRRTGALRFDAEEAAVWLGATSPSQKRRNSAASDSSATSFGASASLNPDASPFVVTGGFGFLRVFA